MVSTYVVINCSLGQNPKMIAHWHPGTGMHVWYDAVTTVEWQAAEIVR